MERIKRFILVFAPRFIKTKVCVINETVNKKTFVCNANDIRNDDVYDEIIEVKVFNLFGWHIA